MHQGLTSAPRTFQRLMEMCMGNINLKEVLVFLDDLTVFSKSLEEHDGWLLQVLAQPKEYGLKILEKCSLIIKNYSQVAKPSDDLTSGYPPLKKSCKKAEKEHQYHYLKDHYHYPFGGH